MPVKRLGPRLRPSLTGVPTIIWFRRDLRLAGNPALTAAIDAARADPDPRVVPLFVVEPTWWASIDDHHRAHVLAALRSLDAAVDDQLLLQHGDPARILPALVRAASATSVHIAVEHRSPAPAGDLEVAAALDVALVRTDAPADLFAEPGSSPYDLPGSAVAPGAVRWWMPVECHGYPIGPDILAGPRAGQPQSSAD